MACTRTVYMQHLGFSVRCGKCPSCLKVRRSQWTARLLHELPYHEEASFVTLTYDDDHVPTGGTVVKRDLQLFFKRLRKSLCGHRIKYFASGEYGDTTRRPHYHAILFGVDDHDLTQQAWTCPDDGLPIGIVHTGSVTARSIAYVTGYVLKKVISDDNAHYKQLGVDPPFQLQSRGLGLRYAVDHKSYYEQGRSPHVNGGVVPVPRYYRDKLELNGETLAARVEESIDDAIAAIESIHGVKFPAIKLRLQPAAYLTFLREEHNIDIAQESTAQAKFSLDKKGKI